MQYLAEKDTSLKERVWSLENRQVYLILSKIRLRLFYFQAHPTGHIQETIMGK